MFIKSGNAIINTSHIVHAAFVPAASGIDEETDEAYSHPAMLTLRCAVVESEEITRYDGDFLGVRQDPYKIAFRGDDAEYVWMQLCGNADSANNG